MIPIHNYLLFKQLAGVIFLIELISIYPFFYRYFGLPYNPRSFIRSKPVAVLTATIVSIAALSIALNAWPIVGALLLLCFYRYVNVDCRFASLSRGAGAVGLVPYYVALYLFLFELSLFVDHSGQLYLFLSMVFRIHIATMVICAGVTKSLSGYAQGDGVEFALANPVWSNFQSIFVRIPPSSKLFWFQNRNAMFMQIASGIFLLIPGTQWLGGLMIILVYIYVTAVINVALLGVLMIAIGLVFLPEFGISFLPQISEDSLYLQFDESPFVARVLYVSTGMYICVNILVKLILYFQKYLGLKLPGFLQTIVQLISRHVPVFMWRVFTRDLSNDFIRIIEVAGDGQEKVIFDEHLLIPRTLGGTIRHYRFWHPTEVVTLTTIAHQLNYPDGESKATEMLGRYVKTLEPEISATDSTIRFEIVHITKQNDSFQFGAIRNLTYQPDGSLIEIERPG